MAESSSKLKENTVGKGEIARYEQFLLFPQCFQKLYCRHVQNKGFFGNGLNSGEKFRKMTKYKDVFRSLLCSRYIKTQDCLLKVKCNDRNH